MISATVSVIVMRVLNPVATGIAVLVVIAYLMIDHVINTIRNKHLKK